MILVDVVLAILAISALLATYKLIRFRDSASKVVVLDSITTLTTGVLVILSLILHTPFVLDIALIYAILSFAAVLLVARYLERSI